MIKNKLISLILGVASTVATHAQFTPLTVTPDSYNADIVVEKGATPLPAQATTATLDAGTNNTANTFYEQGFNGDSPSSGLPAAGSTVTSESLLDHNYTLPASYTTNNAFLLDATVSNATYTVTSPTTLTAISFLAASGGGAGTNNVIIHHADNTVETNQIVVPDWFGGDNPAITLNGRVDSVSRTFDNVDSGNPRLYSVDTTVANSSPVTSIDLQFLGGGHVGIFAVSGANGAEFNNLAGTGFDYDMVVEATADQAISSGINATTATLDAGVQNTGFTWYEQGYDFYAPTTGLPAPGNMLTNSSAADHVYQLPPDYTVANAILIDSANPSATVTLATPRTATGLSFLGDSGNGAMPVNFTIHHVDGSTQDGAFTVPDWFNNTPVAYTVNGRIDAVTGGLQVGGGNPRLYGIDVAIEDTASPITSIDLNYATGTGHATILAISSSAGAILPLFDLQPNSTNLLAGGNGELDAHVTGAEPISVRWQVGTNGNFVDLTNGGVFSGVSTTNLVLTGVNATNAADYRLIALNSVGSSTSSIARVNIVSTKTDVTTPGDTVTAVGGSSPGAESVDHVIDDDTQKYLNYGTDGDQNSPFVGPVGFEVTLSNGPAVVTGLRVYTANDAPERDPIDFKLEGSNDGTTYTTVATGALSLPLTRNASGQPIDPLALANEEVSFANSAGYSTYRLTFANVRNNATANSVQVGEVELLGTAGAGSASLSVARNSDGTITITSSGPGTLESTTSLNPPVTWNNEGAINGSTTVPATGTMQFFRVVQ